MQPKSLLFILLFGYFGSTNAFRPYYPSNKKYSSPLSSYESSHHTFHELAHQIREVDRRPSSLIAINSNDDYETSDSNRPVTASMVPYPSDNHHSYDQQQTRQHQYDRHSHQMLSTSPSSYLDRGSQRDVESANDKIYEQAPRLHQQRRQYHHFHHHGQELDKSASDMNYDYGDGNDDAQDDQYGEESEHGTGGAKDGTVGDLYYKQPSIESEYEAIKDSEGSSSTDYNYPHGTVTTTQYKTGRYVKPKGKSYSSSYPKEEEEEEEVEKTITHTYTVPQKYPGYKEPDQSVLNLPSLEFPILDNIPKELLSKNPVKFPSLDLNLILGNLIGKNKGKDPQISFEAPEGASKLLTALVGHGKPLTINAPNIEIPGITHGPGDARKKLVGFDVPGFIKAINSLTLPKIDLSGDHASGLTVPHIDLPKTESKGKSPIITAIAPLGPSIHFLRHLPFPGIPKFKLPEIFQEPFKNLHLNDLKIPALDLTKNFKGLQIQKKDGMATAEDTMRPTYVAPPGSIGATGKISVYSSGYPIGKAIQITKPKKIVTAYPLQRGPLSGHVVIEDYPYGRQQYGPLDDGGEAEIGCAELDKIIHSKAIASNSLYQAKRPYA